MENDENKELERIKQAKLREKMKRLASEKQGTSLNEPVEMTDATFKEMIQNHSLVVVDCWAPWCGPCQMVAPVIKELARDYAGKILFGKLNVDNNQEVSTQYEIMSIPTLLVFKNGKLVDTIIGAAPRQMLEPKIRSYL
ncbi:MAG: thioredoxin [Nitrososphaeria archaeon]|jgi:thioredoxin 1